MPPPDHPTLNDLVSDYVMRPTRPTPRHMAAGRRRTRPLARAAATLAAARQAVRDALTAAIVGTGTPPGGLTLHATPQRPGGTS